MIGLKIDPGGTLSLPDRLHDAEQECLRGSGDRVADTIGRASQSNQIAAATRVASVSSDQAEIVIGAGVPFARIRDVGGTITPRTGRVLRFASGQFRPRARQRGIRYISRAERSMGHAVDDAFHEAFARL